jgi:2-polyprenyl-3-methyl-5-hydroxy-6-metoxy-1,4-benzoquinol methylase
MSVDKRKRIQGYQHVYQNEYGFESVLVSARQRLILDLIATDIPSVVVEIGCGIDLLYQRVAAAGLPINQWIIVEPSEEFVQIASSAARQAKGLHVVPGFVEDVVAEVMGQCSAPPSMVICSGVLHEVPDVGKVLEAIHRILVGGGLLHANVPNSLSMHRRLARVMGLISNEKELTERNKALAQFRVFDPESLKEAVEAAGFAIEDHGGYFVKPFTHAQMQAIRPILTTEILDGLWGLGRELPELASEIYVNARVRR